PSVPQLPSDRLQDRPMQAKRRERARAARAVRNPEDRTPAGTRADPSYFTLHGHAGKLRGHGPDHEPLQHPSSSGLCGAFGAAAGAPGACPRKAPTRTPRPHGALVVCEARSRKQARTNLTNSRARKSHVTVEAKDRRRLVGATSHAVPTSA